MDALQLVWHQARYEIMQQIKYTKILKSINLLKDFCRSIWKLDWKIGKYVYAFNQIEYKMCMYCNIFIFVFFFIKDIKSGPAMSTWGEVSVDSKVKIPIRSVQCTMYNWWKFSNICVLKSVQCYGVFFNSGVWVVIFIFLNLQ